MKTQASILALAGAMVQGVEVELGQILDIPDDGIQATGQIVQWLSDKIANTTQPSTRFGIQLQLPLLNKYGCWCYRGSDYTNFKLKHANLLKIRKF